MSAVFYTICYMFPLQCLFFDPHFFVTQKRMGRSTGSQERHCQKIQRQEGGRRDGAQQQILAAGRRAEGVGRQRHQAIRGQRFRLACHHFSELWMNDDGRRELQSVAVAEQAGAVVAVQPAHQHSSLRHQPCCQRSALRCYRRNGAPYLPIPAFCYTFSSRQCCGSGSGLFVKKSTTDWAFTSGNGNWCFTQKRHCEWTNKTSIASIRDLSNPPYFSLPSVILSIRKKIM